MRLVFSAKYQCHFQCQLMCNRCSRLLPSCHLKSVCEACKGKTLVGGGGWLSMRCCRWHMQGGVQILQHNLQATQHAQQLLAVSWQEAIDF